MSRFIGLMLALFAVSSVAMWLGRLLPADVLAFHGDGDVFLLHRQRALVYQLTRHPGVDMSPVWSPDGRQIVFVSDRTRNKLNLHLLDLEPPRRIQVLSEFVDHGLDPAWSPDGCWIAYASTDPAGSYDIFMLSLANRRPLRLTDHAAIDANPTWSPDGRQIGYISMRDETRPFYVDLETGFTTMLPLNGGASDLVWLNNGQTLAFMRSFEAVPGLYFYDMPTGTEEHLMEFGFIQSPAWSPNGRHVAFAGQEVYRTNGQNQLYFMDIESRQPHPLSIGIKNVGAPAWKPSRGTHVCL